MASRQRFDAREKQALLRTRAPLQISRDGLPRYDRARAGQNFYLGGEAQTVIIDGVIKRFNAEPIAGHNKFVARSIEDGEGEHPFQPNDHFASPTRISMQEGFGIARATPLHAAQFRAQREVIINFAVHNEDVAGRGIDHRLRTRRRKIEDGQARIA